MALRVHDVGVRAGERLLFHVMGPYFPLSGWVYLVVSGVAKLRKRAHSDSWNLRLSSCLMRLGGAFLGAFLLWVEDAFQSTIES